MDPNNSDQPKEENKEAPKAPETTTVPEIPAQPEIPTTPTTSEPAKPAQEPVAPVSAETNPTPAVEPMTPTAPTTSMEASQSPTPTSPMPVGSPDKNTSDNSPDPGYTETKSNKLLYVLVFILVVILISLAGLFLYKQFLTNTTETAQPVAETTPAENPTITPGSANDEEAAVKGLEVPDIDKELQDINLDVNQL